MDEKKLDQAQSLEDEQLEDVSGGSRILSLNSAEATGEESDTMRDSMKFHPFFPTSASDFDDDEELDGGIPHLPRVNPTQPR